MGLDRIVITGARQHNLKNVTVEIPKKKEADRRQRATTSDPRQPR